jgi:cobalt-zinc-cadmium efflux system membrane fusion protein
MHLKQVAFPILGLVVGLVLGVGWPRLQRHGLDTDQAGVAHAEDDQGHAVLNTDDEHGDHTDHGVVHLDVQAAEKLGIELATAGAGSLAEDFERPGEVVLNDNRVAHIVPQAPGIVREVVKNVGDAVNAGEVMAWLESAELGRVKADYLAMWAEVGCCAIDYARAQDIHDNTLKLLETLRNVPSLETLREMEKATTGDYGRLLVSAYAELEVRRAAYLRERALLEKGVSSERDFQSAESAYKKATAEYAATRDSTEFAVQRNLLEARRAQQVRQIELKSAERHLYVLGLSAQDIRELEALAQSQAPPGEAEPACNDPNCKDCAEHTSRAPQTSSGALASSNERLAWYALRAPFNGTVIQKHITLGERLDGDSNPFTIADLSSVWVDINLYQRDLSHVKAGQQVTISGSSEDPPSEGTIAFVAPTIGKDTRTVLARVVLPNPDGRWRPGLYVAARIPAVEQGVSVLVPKNAIQTLDDEAVVFVPTDGGFEPRPVSIGRSNPTHAEILSGLSPGERYVAAGAFALKAEMITSGLGSHAGHGH